MVDAAQGLYSIIENVFLCIALSYGLGCNLMWYSKG